MDKTFGPESLVTDRFRLNDIQKKALDKLGIKTLADILLYLPSRYGEAGEAKTISDLKVGDNAIIYGQVKKAETKKAFRRRIPMAESIIEDETGTIKAIWFHQAYMAKKAPTGSFAYFRGKVTEKDGKIYLANPEIISATAGQVTGGSGFKLTAGTSLFSNDDNKNLVPFYPETRGISSGWFYYHVDTLLREKLHEQIIDPIPTDILKKFNLPPLAKALVWVHTPKSQQDAEVARKRFAFEEVFFIQLSRLRDRLAYKSHEAAKIKVPKNELADFIGRFPFTPTPGQNKAIGEILREFTTGKPMTRLLEGDVGSGKTAVAAATAFGAVAAGFEVAYMAPTEILAKQHFESFITYFKHLNVQVGLITGKKCWKFPSKISPSGYTEISRSQLLKWVEAGTIPILIGTHALIQKKVKFKNLAYVIIDEQHRFGVMQRSKLAQKESAQAPHLLSMTATPIPRTLALTIYGDLDLSLLPEMPAGRKPIITDIIPPTGRETLYEKVRTELKSGRQAYVICPRIDEPDPEKKLALQTRSAKAEQKRLAEKVFPEYSVGLLHSKMKPAEKDEVMEDFSAGKIDILVATSVVEVGVNVPNATIILIEGAERFGLAQLHQLRGRVIRGTHQAYCYLLTETKSETSMKRLKALKEAKNGFELAELDLALRGAGLLSGEKQWGVSDLGMEAIRNIKMVEAARSTAQEIIKTDPEFKKHPKIKKVLATRTKTFHFE